MDSTLPDFTAQSYDGTPLGSSELRAMAPVLVVLLRGLF